MALPVGAVPVGAVRRPGPVSAAASKAASRAPPPPADMPVPVGPVAVGPVSRKRPFDLPKSAGIVSANASALPPGAVHPGAVKKRKEGDAATALPDDAALAAAAAAAGLQGMDLNALASLAGLPGMGGSDPNALYTQLAAAALQLEEGGVPFIPPQAFDKTALAKLAQKAADGDIEEPPPRAFDGEADGEEKEIAPAPLPVGPLRRSKKQGASNVREFLAAEQALNGAQASAQGPVSAASSAVGADGEAAKPLKFEMKKEKTAVLQGVLQAVQDNFARNRTGGARGKVEIRGFEEADKVTGEKPSSTSLAGAAMLESVITKLQLVSTDYKTESRKAAEAEVLVALPRLDPARATEVICRVHAVEALRTSEFLEEMARAIRAVIPTFNSPQLARIVATLAQWTVSVGSGVGDDGASRLSDELRDCFNAAQAEVPSKLSDMVPGDLARLASAFAQVGLGAVQLFTSFGRAAISRSDRFAPNEMITLVGAFEKARLFHPTLFDALARNLKVQVREIGLKDTLRGMRALAAAGVRDEDLAETVGAAAPKMKTPGLASSNAEELLALGWTFCTLDLHNERFFRSVFRAVEEAEDGISSDALCHLYDIHTVLQAFHNDDYRPYELEKSSVEELREHYVSLPWKAHGRPWKLEPDSDSIRSEIAEVLKEVVDGSISIEHVTSMGFVVDIAVTRKRSTSSAPLIVIDVDGPSTQLQTLSQGANDAVGGPRLRGGLALKRRVLLSHGIKVAVVSEDEWVLLDGRRRKQECLRIILQQAGLSRDRLL